MTLTQQEAKLVAEIEEMYAWLEKQKHTYIVIKFGPSRRNWNYLFTFRGNQDHLIYAKSIETLHQRMMSIVKNESIPL